MLNLLEADEVRITTVIDNAVDSLMPDSVIAHRYHPDPGSQASLIAEHGFSAIIQVRRGANQGTILLDTGVNPSSLLYNMKLLGINIDEIQAIILSHGHFDHTKGLPELLKQLKNKELSLVFHPDVRLERRAMIVGRDPDDISSPKLADLQSENVTFVETANPVLLADDTILASGEIPRTTDFEKGFPIHYAKRHGEWEPDPLIKDDQCVIVNVRGQGLVIITGCGHAGIVNTISHAQALTGIQKIFLVMGGFHLSGGLFEKIIPETVSRLKEINPRYIMPGHCTGWTAIHQIACAMPDAFIPVSVGTRMVIQGVIVVESFAKRREIPFLSL
jgi:7,8-dihydropterin-6-yl-methyl-4-(beta-D-ribofuranosyl)aminobenzene 5'-phosphate synthase